jgi:hypothetical protein
MMKLCLNALLCDLCSLTECSDICNLIKDGEDGP